MFLIHPMRTLEITFLDFSSDFPELEEISVQLDRIRRNMIDQLNWKDFNYRPEAGFSIAYTNREILLKYFVTENYFKAEKTETNQNVFEDSCVEFFFSPEEDGIYYNFEFNGIGTCLMGSGTSRTDRQKAVPEIIDRIRRVSSLGKNPVPERKGNTEWTLTAAIPFSALYRHDIKTLKGKTGRANFYKCGDRLSVPHYLTWNPVKTEKPDFHRPEFFGMIEFS